jgi:hypothetical protein
VRILRITFVTFALLIMAVACSPATPQTSTTHSPLPTASVPAIADIDKAIATWEKSNTFDYFTEVQENTPEGKWKYRLVIADNQVRAAQKLQADASGNWGEPQAMSPEEASQYTVKAILDRIRRDASGEGPVPFNMKATFDSSLGYPVAVRSEALPYYNEEGNLVLDRTHGYDLSTKVKALLEDTYSAGRGDPIFILTRGGGPEAWCDSLRIFSNGSSLYTDDCRDSMLQLELPDKRLEELQNLRKSFASLDDLQEQEGQTLRLIITGSGEGTPDADTLQAAWDWADTAQTLLSKPVGLGQTILYTQDGKLLGFDVFNKTTQLANLSIKGQLYGVVLNTSKSWLAYSDDSGVNYLDLTVGQTNPVLPTPEEGYYLPITWNDLNYLILEHLSSKGEEAAQFGWVSPEDMQWHDLPLLQDGEDYGCDIGLAQASEGAQLAITGLAYGSTCNHTAGLTVVDLEGDRAQSIVAPMIQDGSEEGTQLVAGTHTPAWSLDNQWIAFGLDQDAESPLNFTTRLYRVQPDGNLLTPLTNNFQGVAAHPAWAPDGSLYYSLDNASAESDGIYHYSPDTNTHELLIPGSNIYPISVSPDGEFLLYQQDGDLNMWAFLEDTSYNVVTHQGEGQIEFAGWLAGKGQ